HKKYPAHIADHPFVQWFYENAGLGIFHMFASDAEHDGIHFRLRGVPRHSRTQSTNSDHVSPATKSTVGGHWNPNIRCAKISKTDTRWHDADHAVKLVIEDDLPT